MKSDDGGEVGGSGKHIFKEQKQNRRKYVKQTLSVTIQCNERKGWRCKDKNTLC